MEVFIKNFLDSKNIKFIYRERSILDGYEIDIYIPSHKLGIEMNGLYWHTEIHKDKELHKLKADLAEQYGIKLIQIFEDEYKNNIDIVLSRISNLLNLNQVKIHARKCIIKEVNGLDKIDFLNKNHIQGNSNTSINLGLYFNNELISLMTFSKERIALGVSKSKDGNYELNRFCSKLGVNVVGGASKLFKFFIKKYSPKRIISYADRRWSSGSLYDKLGFNFIKNTNCNYWYTIDYIKREHRFSFRKNVLSNKLDNYNPDLSESENMKLNGYVRIWDAGSKKYEFVVD
jgi:very-short-patch-repair endonuclease